MKNLHERYNEALIKKSEKSMEKNKIVKKFRNRLGQNVSDYHS